MNRNNAASEVSSSLSNHGAKRTVYVNNLNERVPLSKQEIVLEKVFAKYGEIESIKMFSSYYRKGQAWIKFSSTDAAVTALKSEDGTQLFGKHVNVSFAAEESGHRNITIRSCKSNSPMIPKSISTHIELYRQYLAQWLKNSEDNGLLQSLNNTEKNQINFLNNQVLYDINYANFIRSNKCRKTVKQSINEPTFNSLKRKPETQIDDSFPLRHSKCPNSINSLEVGNTVFVQIETGLCKEEELYTLFSQINGFRELRFIPVSF